jgi:hypothetical protein
MKVRLTLEFAPQAGMADRVTPADKYSLCAELEAKIEQATGGSVVEIKVVEDPWTSKVPLPPAE